MLSLVSVGLVFCRIIQRRTWKQTEDDFGWKNKSDFRF